MAPKRKRAHQKQAPAEDNDAEQEPAAMLSQEDAGADAAGHIDSDPAPQGRASRMEQMAEIAQRRAAHFATFEAEQSENEDQEDNVHVGGDEANKLGPWSSARQLVEQRAAAAEARRGRLLAQADDAGEGLVEWKPSRPGWQTSQRTRRRTVPSLSRLCVLTVADCIDYVESLTGLPQVYLNQLAECVSNRRKLSADAWQLFTSDAPVEVIVPNCTQVDEASMVAGLKACCTHRLERMELGFCGRGFGDAAAAAVAEIGPLRALRELQLAGAYRLGPEALLKAAAAAPDLHRLCVPACVCLQGAAVLPQLAAALPQLRHLDLSACRGLDGPSLAAGLRDMHALRALYLDEVEAVDDAVLEAAATPQLAVLHVRRCRRITDGGIATAAAAATALTDLALSETAASAASLSVLSAACPALAALQLRQCMRVKDEAALVAIAQQGVLRRLDVSTVPAVSGALLLELAAMCSKTLEELDLSFCRGVPANAVGHLLDACSALRVLQVFGCSQLTKAALRGHSNVAVDVCGEPTLEGGMHAQPVLVKAR
eukprot:jgi/Ulvmu1/8126/UM040_0021.1